MCAWKGEFPSTTLTEVLDKLLEIEFFFYWPHLLFSPAQLSGPDYFIRGILARNRAFQDDLVVVQVLPEDQWAVSGVMSGIHGLNVQ